MDKFAEGVFSVLSSMYKSADGSFSEFLQPVKDFLAEGGFKMWAFVFHKTL